MLDFIRIACAVPEVKVADVQKNARDICSFMEQADGQNVDVIVFPELILTGYTCGDLFFQDTLWKGVKTGLKTIADCSGKLPNLTAVVGLPVRVGTRLYNCAAVISRGEVCGLVPKTYLTPGEKRWFSSGKDMEILWLEPGAIGLSGSEDYWSVPMGANQLFRLGDDVLAGIEICEDMMVPQPRSSVLSVNGAEVILNLSASPELAGKRAFRRNLVANQSAVCSCIYAYVSAGCTESTTDMIFSGHSMIAETGRMLRENANYVDSGYMLVMDCDIGRVRADRLRSGNFGATPDGWLTRDVFGHTLRSDGALYPVRKLPFVPDTRAERLQRCREIFQLQVTGLKQRLTAIGGANAVIGISGGLDSTLALLVAVEAMRQLGRPAADVYGVTMPCFGTSDRTYRNAWELMRTLGISIKEIVIKDAVSLHFSDIGHDPQVHNATYENAQARERTQILMDYASVVGGIVVGTGDLSELALGWCTYNGDHMSMYSVNGTVPKTLMRWMIDAISETESFAAAREVLRDVLDTPISPELLPPDASGKISQQTEDLVGPYALHDFFIFHVLRYGFAPKKIYTLACRAFETDFEPAFIKKWLVSFYRRFFTQQFKRSCMPDGVKVGSVGLGPRGDWSMPSDAAVKLWLEEAENL
ncbi:MAG: NAD(+) synthase [Oscillospiraceae bacterium]|nr:NAD(+) synthase [Oscillospiraceae bacterium]